MTGNWCPNFSAALYLKMNEESTSASLVGPLTPRPNISVKAKPTKVSSAALENRRRPAPYHEAGLLPFSRATIETFVGFAFTEMLSVSELNWLT